MLAFFITNPWFVSRPYDYNKVDFGFGREVQFNVLFPTQATLEKNCRRTCGKCRDQTSS